MVPEGLSGASVLDNEMGVKVKPGMHCERCGR